MSAGGYARLIIAGDPQMTSRVRNALPQHLVACCAIACQGNITDSPSKGSDYGKTVGADNGIEKKVNFP